ncbi:uncharacterized protein LOC143058778 [Mytilus galloprovincialis]|uniref:uncharacterized protein LOC143058778 n=1 Tax=Mytilus galloprovincialis TaxID=29158 RepID=UPI003F7C4D36
MEANITLDKVYPTPECNFTDWGRDLKQNITVTNKRNGLFYTSNIYLLYENIDRCNRHDRPVAVICSVGETSFTVVNNTVKCPDDKPESSSKKYLPFWAVVIASGCAGLVILACISIVYLTLWNYRRTRNASSSSQEQDNADAMSDFANDSLLIQHCSSVIQDESI